MSHSKLHDFDFELCCYLRSNIRQACQSSAVRADLLSELNDNLLAYFGDSTSQSDIELHEQVLLSTADLVDLEIAIGAFASRTLWEPYHQLHRRAVYCVREIRDELTIHDAEVWSIQSTKFSAKLDRRKLSLIDGTRTVSDWIRCVRRFLFGMGRKDLIPIPEGRFPTPANPTLLEQMCETRDVDPYVQLMRTAIQNHPNGRLATVNELIREAGVNRQLGLKALQALRDSNEYFGKRRRAVQRRQGREK